MAALEVRHVGDQEHVVSRPAVVDVGARLDFLQGGDVHQFRVRVQHGEGQVVDLDPVGFDAIDEPGPDVEGGKGKPVGHDEFRVPIGRKAVACSEGAFEDDLARCVVEGDRLRGLGMPPVELDGVVGVALQ
ncbi:hypothetical protein D3C85_1345770 [compost metagenome]